MAWLASCIRCIRHIVPPAAQQKKLIGSGGGLRNNRFLCESFSRAFNSAITLSDGREEAACGAALYAAD